MGQGRCFNTEAPTTEATMTIQMIGAMVEVEASVTSSIALWIEAIIEPALSA